MTETQTTTTATAAQAKFIADLLNEREGYTPGFAQRVRDGLASGAMSKSKASEVIDWMTKLPKRPRARVGTATPYAPPSGIPGSDGTPPLVAHTIDTSHTVAGKLDIPAGHYAVEVPGSSEPLSFVRVDRPTEGKWANMTFVKHIVGGHPDYPIRGAAAMEVLRAIDSTGVVAAAKRYAAEFTRCLHCNTQLTDPLSRSIGIGPYCRAGKARGGFTPLINAVLGAAS